MPDKPSIRSLLGRLFKGTGPAAEPVADAPARPRPADPPGIHPGLTDEQLVVILTAAAHEMLEQPVRIAQFRPLTMRDLSWATQGRRELQTHRLK